MPKEIRVTVPLSQEEHRATKVMAAAENDQPPVGRLCQRLVAEAVRKAGFLKETKK